MKDYRTGQRRQLLAFLEQHSDHPLPAEQIESMIRSGGGEISLSAIYRNLDRLVQDGLVRRLPAEDGRKALYQLIGEECAGHLHMQCTGCGSVIHMDEKATRAMNRAAQACGDFSIDRRRTVLYGRCKNCRD